MHVAVGLGLPPEPARLYDREGAVVLVTGADTLGKDDLLELGLVGVSRVPGLLELRNYFIYIDFGIFDGSRRAAGLGRTPTRAMKRWNKPIKLGLDSAINESFSLGTAPRAYLAVFRKTKQPS